MVISILVLCPNLATILPTATTAATAISGLLLCPKPVGNNQWLLLLLVVVVVAVVGGCSKPVGITIEK